MPGEIHLPLGPVLWQLSLSAAMGVLRIVQLPVEPHLPLGALAEAQARVSVFRALTTRRQLRSGLLSRQTLRSLSPMQSLGAPDTFNTLRRIDLRPHLQQILICGMVQRIDRLTCGQQRGC